MQRIIKNLIYAYALTLFVQQLCIVFGIEPINLYFSLEDKWKLPSLAQEPSHMAIFLFFFMYSFILVSEKITGQVYSIRDARNDKLVWLSYFWCMLTSHSTSALFYCGLIFLRYVNAKTLFRFSFLGIVLFILVSFWLQGTEAYQRASAFSEAFLTFDINKINEADHSAAYRFFPIFYFVNNVDILSPQFWFGHGLDYAKEVINSFALDISGDVAYNGDINIGGFCGYIMDYGMVCFLAFLFAIKSAIRKLKEPWLMITYIWLNLFIGFNMQLFWSSTVLISYFAIYNEKNK